MPERTQVPDQCFFEEARGLLDVDVPNQAVLTELLRRTDRPFRRLAFARPADLRGLASAPKAFPALKTIAIDSLENSASSLIQLLTETKVLQRVVHLEIAINGVGDVSHLLRGLAVEPFASSASRVERVSLRSHNAFVSIARGLVIEGHDEWLWVGRQLLEALDSAKHVTLTARDYKNSDCDAVKRWFSVHGAPHTLHLVPRVDAESFHHHLLSVVSS